MDEASAIKGRANLLFEKKEYDDAIVQYTEVLGVLPARTSNSHDEGEGQDQSTEAPTEDGEDAAVVEKMRILRAVVYANIAACHLAKKEFKEAVVACNESLQDDSLYLKALNRRAQANEEIGTWSSLTSSLEGEYSLPETGTSHADVSFLSPSRRLQDNEWYATPCLSGAYVDGRSEEIAWQSCRCQ